MSTELAGLELIARSIGGIETCIEVPEYRLAFDIGRCPDTALRRDVLLLTHAHIDHMAGLAWHAGMRRLRGMKKPLYIVPPAIEEPVRGLFEAWARLDNGYLDHELVALAAGERRQLRQKLWVEPFRSPHRAPTNGYALIEVHKKLKPEFAGLAGEELGRLRRAGEEIDERAETVELAFTGDSCIEVVEGSDLVRTARRLILECTFVDDRVPPEEARRKGHVHLRQIAERADLFENEAILLTHFSSRYRQRDIVAAIEKELPQHLRERVTPLLGGHKR